MQYTSTRAGAAGADFAAVTLEGLAPDGGLYVPVSVPRLEESDIARLRTLDYAGVAADIIGRFAGPEHAAMVGRVCDDAYTPEVFGSAAIAPLTTLEDGLHILELSNGPTLAFKDMAMQFLGRLFDELLAEDDQWLTVLGATSGDTGSAAEAAVIGLHRVGIVMLSPWKRVSPFQAAQMYTIDEPNILNLAIEGVFDEAQDLVKAITGDASFKARHHLGAMNSINWSRIAAQIVYYVWGWLRASRDGGPVTFSVPTGNFGNIYAGLVAQRMGLPLRFVLATNENDVLAEFFATGTYRVRANDEVAATSSPSMDIAKASNFERLIHDAVGDPATVADLWHRLDTTSSFDLSGTPVWDRIGERHIVAGSSTHADRLTTIADVHDRYGRIIDPHTADGVKVGRELADPAVPLVCLETAQPTKFEATIREALGSVPPRPDRLAGLEDRPQRVDVVPATADVVRAKIEAFTTSWRR